MAEQYEEMEVEVSNYPAGRSEEVDVIDRIFDMPQDAQLGILRTIAPKILASLPQMDLEGYLRDLQDEIDRALKGEQTYDLRPGMSAGPTIH